VTGWDVFRARKPSRFRESCRVCGRTRGDARQDIILGPSWEAGHPQPTWRAGIAAVRCIGRETDRPRVALRLSVFSPDAICGITPIELMLESTISTLAARRCGNARSCAQARARELSVPGRVSGTGCGGGRLAIRVPSKRPLVFSGITESTLREFGPMFQQSLAHLWMNP